MDIFEQEAFCNLGFWSLAAPPPPMKNDDWLNEQGAKTADVEGR
jgi:hypothetical protein